MPSLPLDIRRQAKSLVEAGKTSAEVGVLLDIKPGTVREWKRRYMWDGPEGQERPCNDDMGTDQTFCRIRTRHEPCLNIHKCVLILETRRHMLCMGVMLWLDKGK